MAAIQLAGLASGLDWKSLVDQIIQADGSRVTRLRTQQTTIAQQNTAINSLKDKLQALGDAVKGLGDPAVYSSRTSSVGNDLWSVSAGANAPPGAHTIQVTQLATVSRFTGQPDIAAAIRSDGDASQVLVSAMNIASPITAGEFTVNGSRVGVATTDSLDEVFQKIAAATGGKVTAAYDGGTDRVKLSSAEPVILGSSNDTSNFLTALKLSNNGTATVESATRLGTAKLDTPIASAGLSQAITGLDQNGLGKMLVNGKAIAFNPATDTVRSVMARINAADAGVVASYDSEADRMVLTNQVTGDLGVAVKDDTGNLAAVLGLTSGTTLERGRNAEFSVDGGTTRTSTSNVLDEAALGLPGLTVTAATESTEHISVTNDVAGAKSKILDFMAKFNDVQSFIDQQTKITVNGTTVTTGVLSGNHEIRDLARSLRSAAFNAITGGTGGIQSLDALGIGFSGTTGQLKLTDSSKLDDILSSKADSVSGLFTTATSGLAARFGNLVEHQVGFDGTLVNAVTLGAQRSSRISAQITEQQRRLEAERSTLEARFTAMEQMQSTLKGQLQTLTNAFGGTQTT